MNPCARTVQASPPGHFAVAALEPTVEQRKHQRYHVRFNSIFSTDGDGLEKGLVLDLSLGGCRLMSTIYVPSGCPIEVHIRPDQHSPIYVPSAVVRWTGESVCGLEFNELPELESATLTRLLWTLRSLRAQWFTESSWRGSRRAGSH